MRERVHSVDCAWTLANCEYKATHYYCPHPEHECSCAPVPDTSAQFARAYSQYDEQIVALSGAAGPPPAGSAPDWGPPINVQWLQSLLMMWWAEDGWARPDALYARETRDVLKLAGLLDHEGSATERGRNAVEWARGGPPPTDEPARA